ncbi:NAD(P)/FAD-dependent oxidoreductase [Paracoccus seriniphilus]|uniref:Gamma-glutamylputrescine oxidase n=1 Tax=Paracoccus seriniphilus TaxID=184748 RepID=A0A239Q1K6_9RHOB|nr:FAD-binding oxidoreductase [Paracoccus seriniphilus]WCR14499.1 FAD-binding oxidoreductase [Paracoccus seriniphilus]SNT76384.1 gamma-glutamylputrescine oxidase [Paracoccus seriniphilus]
MNLLYMNDRRGHYPDSVYAATKTDLAPFPRLRGETRADVAVVGGGYTGLSAALHLARAGLDVVLVEAHRVGFGASGRNGGQIGSGQRQEVDWLEQQLGAEQASRLWNLAEQAKELVRGLAAEASVPVRDGIVHACRNQAEVDHARHMAEHLRESYGYDRVETLDSPGLAALIGSEVYHGGDVDWGAGHVHPLNLALGMARLADQAGARLHEDTHVHRVTHARKAGEKTIVHCDTGRILCDHLVLAGNGYLGDIEPKVSARVMPINNYIVATEPLGNRFPEVLPRNTAAADTKFVVNYWRLDDERRLIFGGGETVTYRFPKDIVGVVRRHLLSVYPQLADVALTHAWGGTLAITMNRMPFFARPAPNCLSASGFSGHGVAMATLSGRLMADAIAGQAAGFDTMAAVTTRSFPGGAMLRGPLLVAGMAWYGLRDRLGF